MKSQPDPMTFASDTPDIATLVSEFKRPASSADFWNRSRLSEDTRLARWESQSEDGKKYDRLMPAGQTAFPFDGASDVRCFQADSVCNENVALAHTAFWRAELRVSGVSPGDIGAGGQATTFMNWLVRQRQQCQFDNDVELSAQFCEWYGWTALHTTWQRELGMRLQKITIDELASAAVRLRGVDPATFPPEQLEPLAALATYAETILDPDREAEAVAATILLHRHHARSHVPADIADEEIGELKRARARKIVRDLRATGSAEFPMPYLCKNEPNITALKPWRDIIVPGDTTDIQSARVIFIRRFMSEAELRNTAVSAGWNVDFVDAAAATKGRASIWSYTGASNTTGSLSPSFDWQQQDEKNNLIEIAWAYQKLVDEDGIQSVYYTVFSPHLTQSDTSSAPLYALHDTLDYAHGDYPITLLRRERLDRQVTASRSTPEILLTSQREEKVQRDALADLTSMAVVPPVNIYKNSMGQRYRFGAGVQNEVSAPGREPRFMEVPTHGAPMALELIRLIRADVNRYFGLFSAEVPPALNQILMEHRVRRFLTAWGNALKQAYSLTLQYGPELIARVTASPPQMNAGDASYDFVFHFDVAQLNPELMEMKLDAFSKLLPEDAAGVIDRAKLIEAKARIIDPVLARELVMSKGPASQQIYRDTIQELVSMFNGTEAQYTDASNDSTAAMRMQYAQQIIQGNPKFIGALDAETVGEIFGPQAAQMRSQHDSEPDPLFTRYVQNYIQNLKQGVDQQSNKQVGRIGVKPMMSA